MNDAEFNDRVARLQKIGSVLQKLPPEVRSTAFELLKDYVTVGTPGEAPKKRAAKKDAHDNSTGSAEQFFSAFNHDKPADNVKLIAASFYREYGSDPFTLDDVRQTADDVGITIPARPDKTLGQAKEKGKKLFTKAGKGAFKPTVHGEAYLKETYAIRKGTKKRSEAAE